METCLSCLIGVVLWLALAAVAVMVVVAGRSL